MRATVGTSSTNTGVSDRGNHIDKNVLLRDGAEVILPNSASGQWKFMAARDGKPEHYHARVNGIDIHLRNGLKPPVHGAKLVGVVEVKQRTVGGDQVQYVYLNVYPLGNAETTRRVLITKERPEVVGDQISFRHDGKTLTAPGPVFKTWYRSFKDGQGKDREHCITALHGASH